MTLYRWEKSQNLPSNRWENPITRPHIILHLEHKRHFLPIYQYYLVSFFSFLHFTPHLCYTPPMLFILNLWFTYHTGFIKATTEGIFFYIFFSPIVITIIGALSHIVGKKLGANNHITYDYYTALFLDGSWVGAYFLALRSPITIVNTNPYSNNINATLWLQFIIFAILFSCIIINKRYKISPAISSKKIIYRLLSAFALETGIIITATAIPLFFTLI